VEQANNFARILRKLSVISQAFEAAFAQAGRFKFLCDKVENVGWHPGFVTPAISFVGVPGGDPAMVWVAAKRAAFSALERKGFVPLREWLVRHIWESGSAAARPRLLSRETLRARGAGRKSPATTHEGVKAGLNTAQTSSSLPHPIVGAIACRRLHAGGPDEREISRSSGFEVILLASPYRKHDCSGVMKRSSLVTAALPRGNYTRFPILPLGHLFTFQTLSQRTARDVRAAISRVKMKQESFSRESLGNEIILAGRFDNPYSRHSSL
jgi:hypothetical protein